MSKAKKVLKQLNQRPISFYPIYVTITGSLEGGVLLSQLMYWWYAVEEREFYKTDEEIRQETKLSVRELRKAKDSIRSTGLVSVSIKGVPAKTYYSISPDSVIDAIEKCSGESSSSNDGVQSSFNDGVQTSFNDGVQTGSNDGVQTITENTSENTSENFNLSSQGGEKGLDSSQQISPSEFMKFWNENLPGFPKIREMTAKRLAKLKVRREESFFVENWKEAILRLRDSDFARGESPGSRGWVASVDWFLHNGDAVVKILEGKYDNQPQNDTTPYKKIIDLYLSFQKDPKNDWHEPPLDCPEVRRQIRFAWRNLAKEDIDWFRRVWERCSQSKKLSRNEQFGTYFNLTWIFDRSKLSKLIEGRYDNK